MVAVFELFVEGIPVPQGSATAFPVGGRCVVTSANNKKLKPWRALVTQAVLDEMDAGRHNEMLQMLADKDMPIKARLKFYVPKPASVKREWPTVRRGDIDKLSRAVLDSISDAGLWYDDANVVDLHASKYYAGGVLLPGVEIEVRDASW